MTVLELIQEALAHLTALDVEVIKTEGPDSPMYSLTTAMDYLAEAEAKLEKE